MKIRRFAPLLICAALLTLGTAARAAKVGDAAPAFTVTDSNGKNHKLEDFKGKYVVLEWHNKECPFVKKNYETGNMQKLQKEWTGKGVVWLTVLSSAQGKEGYEDAKAANDEMTKAAAAPTAVIMDTKGALGHAFAAKTTPHMFIIGPDGKLIYNGALDDKPSPEAGDVASAKNYVSQALTESLAGKPVSVASTTPYGCGVKY